MIHDNGYSNKQRNHSREGTHSPIDLVAPYFEIKNRPCLPSLTLFQNYFFPIFYFGAKYIVGLIYYVWTFLHNPIKKK
jgi:hypothetical protein